MPIKDLLVGRFSNGVVTLINDQKVDTRQVEEIVIEGIQKHLVNHDQNLQRKNKFISTNVCQQFGVNGSTRFMCWTLREQD